MRKSLGGLRARKRDKWTAGDRRWPSGYSSASGAGKMPAVRGEGTMELMLVQDAIAQRRSIRRYKDERVSEEGIRTVLHAATLAPSGKNRQPWRFVVVQGDDRRAEMVAMMRQGIAKLEAQGVDPGSSKRSTGIMARAPVTVFVFNGDATYADPDRSYADRLFDIEAIQSIGLLSRTCCWRRLIVGWARCRSAMSSTRSRSCAGGWARTTGWSRLWRWDIRMRRPPRASERPSMRSRGRWHRC